MKSSIGPIIGVIDGASPTKEEIATAEVVGQVLAEGRATLVCGGRGGVMEAACRGAKSADGLTIGILPGIRCARNIIITRTAQAMIAVGESYGTLSEIAFALSFGTPVVGLGT